MAATTVLEYLERVTYPLTQVPEIDVLNFPFVSHNWLWIVGICTPLYLMLVFFGPRVMAKREAFDLTYPMIVWNLCLSTLSLFMFFGIGVPTWRTTLQSNASVWYHLVTLDAGYDEPTWVGSHIFWVWLFGLSKVAELFDTVFLVLRKREVPFLHWYHHTTVLSFSLFGMWCLAGPMFLFAIMNSFVHVVMYFYYALTGLGYRPFWGKYITQLQMLQMVVGVTSSASWAYFTLTIGTRMYKDYHLYFTVAAMLMYGSYFYLFLQFYLNRYKAGKSTKPVNKKQ